MEYKSDIAVAMETKILTQKKSLELLPTGGVSMSLVLQQAMFSISEGHVPYIRASHIHLPLIEWNNPTVRPFRLCQFQFIGSADNIQKKPRYPLREIYGLWPLLFCSSQPFFSVVRSSPISLRAVWAVSWIGNHVKWYPVRKYWKYCSGIGSVAFSEGVVGNYWSVTRYHLKSPTPCS